jgi:hypothetical protein
MTLGSHGFYIHAYFGLLPPRTVDMLTVRIGQLTVEGLSPSQIRSLAGCSPNASDKPRGTGEDATKGAKNYAAPRRLETRETY